MPAAAVVLAAGHSSRMGHPKALTRIGDEAALARIVRACEDAGLARPAVVLGAHHDAVRAALPQLDARVAWVPNPHPDAGRTGSLQRGLAHVAADADAILVWPVDHPLVDAATIRALLATPGDWIVPTHARRGGHPIVLRGRAIAAVRAARPDTPLRDVLAAAGARRVEVPAPEGVTRNLDTPRDVA